MLHGDQSLCTTIDASYQMKGNLQTAPFLIIPPPFQTPPRRRVPHSSIEAWFV